MRSNDQNIWVVMHYEIMGQQPPFQVDSVQFHVSSSRRKAEHYIRNIHVAPYSWWQVHPHVLDCEPSVAEGEDAYYYSHAGRRLRKAPHNQAIKAYEKELRRRQREDEKPKPRHS